MFTNTIPVSSKADFSSFAQGIIAKMRAEKNPAQVKTASAKEEVIVKTASKEDDEKMAALRALKGGGKKEQDKEDKKQEKKEQPKKEQKKASSAKFIKVASLDAKTKSMLKKYFANLYPKEYVDALISE